MKRAVPQGLWLGIGAALVLLPALPWPRWASAPDPGPVWLPHLASWAWGVPVVLALALLAGRLAAGRVPRRIPWPTPASRYLVPLLAGLLGAAAALTMRYAFAGNPHLVDEMAQLLHARAFAAGRLALPAPEPPQAFLILHTWITEAGWASQFPPGQTALLAVGLLVHAAWLVNPVLGALGVVLVYLVARGLYGARTARVAAVLWTLSAWVLFMSATYSSHVGATTLALAAWAVLWGRPGTTSRRAALAGLLLGMAAATRPLDGVAAGLPVLAWLAGTRRWREVPWIAAGAVPVAVAWGYLNWKLYGHPLTTGYTAVWGPELRLGFHMDPWGRPFTPLVAWSNAAVAVRRLNIYLFEWPIPALVPLVVWALGARHRRWSDVVLGTGVVAAPLLYFFYWHSGFHVGPRFYYLAAPMLVIGTARAWGWAWAWARRAVSRVIRWDVALATAAAVVLVWSGGWILPQRFAAYRGEQPSLKLHPERALAQHGVTQALVLVPDGWGSRMIVSLWAMGVPAATVETAYRHVHACDLHHLIRTARAEAWPVSDVERRLTELMAGEPAPRVPDWPDPTLRLRPGAITPECRAELDRDRKGFTPYAPLAWRNEVGLRSGIVFARDLFDENVDLLRRYAGWEVWRFAPPPGETAGLPELYPVAVIGDGSR